MADEPERTTSGAISLLRSGNRRGRGLVLLHGIGSNARSWTGLIATLKGEFDIVAWDAPGYGDSKPLGQDWPTPSEYADEVANVLDRLGIENADVVGHSLGALVAGRFAVRHPQRVGRLVLASPALGYKTVPGAPLAPPAGNRLQAMLNEGSPAFAATRGPRLVHDRTNALLVAAVVKAMSEVKLPGYQQASRMLSTGDLIGDAARVAVPTLVVVGAHDEITPPANCKRVHDALLAATPGLGHRFETIDAAGHALPQERPAELASVLGDFLASN